MGRRGTGGDGVIGKVGRGVAREAGQGESSSSGVRGLGMRSFWGVG